MPPTPTTDESTDQTHDNPSVPAGDTGASTGQRGGDELTAVNVEGFRLVFAMARSQPRRMTLSLIGGVLWGVMVVMSTYVLGRVTDDVIRPALVPRTEDLGQSRVWWAVAALIAVGVLRGTSVVMRRWFGSITEAHVQANLRRRFADHLLVMPMPERRRRSIGELLAISDNDVTLSTQALMPLPLFVGLLALIVTAVSSLIAADWTFALIGAILFPLLLVISRYFTEQMVEPASRSQHQVGEVSRVAHESFDGALAVKVLGREQAESARFRGVSDTLRQERLKLARVASLYHPLVDALPYVGMVAIIVAGAFRMRSGAVSQGDVVATVALFGLLTFPVRVTGFLFESIPRSVVSFGRVEEVLDSPTLPEPPDQPGVIPAGPLDVVFDDVSFGFDVAPMQGEDPVDSPDVLSNIELRIEVGEVVALVGPTGSGKSTLCELMVGIEQPRRGQVRIGDVDIADAVPHDVRDAAVLVFQESFLFADTVRANLCLGTQHGDAEIHAALRRAAADGFVNALPEGLDTTMGERGVTLSGGQRQRIALARALLRRPRILILDDATSAVDAKVEERILRGIAADDETSAVTLVVVAHRMSTIRLADRIVYVDQGRVTATGTHDELMAHEGYAALVSAYQRADDEPSASIDEDGRQ